VRDPKELYGPLSWTMAWTEGQKRLDQPLSRQVVPLSTESSNMEHRLRVLVLLTVVVVVWLAAIVTEAAVPVC
jgi:hypothetical protein